MAERLRGCIGVFGKRLRTQTHDPSAYAYAYVSGLLRMESGRNLVGISRQTGVNKQGMQHFMSHSPWSGRAVIREVQDQMAVRPELQEEAMLLLDESGDERAGG